MDNILQNLW